MEVSDEFCWGFESLDFNVGGLIGHLVSPFAGGSFTDLLVNAREHKAIPHFRSNI